MMSTTLKKLQYFQQLKRNILYTKWRTSKMCLHERIQGITNVTDHSLVIKRVFERGVGPGGMPTFTRAARAPVAGGLSSSSAEGSPGTGAAGSSPFPTGSSPCPCTGAAGSSACPSNAGSSPWHGTAGSSPWHGTAGSAPWHGTAGSSPWPAGAGSAGGPRLLSSRQPSDRA